MMYWWQMSIDERERIEFCGRIGRKGKRIGRFKVYFDKKLFGSLNYFRGYYECDPFAGLVLVIL